MNRLVTRSETQPTTKGKQQQLSEHRRPGRDGFTDEFYKTYKEFIQTLFRLFQETEEEGSLPKSFNKATIMLIPKSDKDTTNKENYGPISLMNIDAKFSTKYQPTKSNKRSQAMIKLDSFHSYKDGSVYANQSMRHTT